MKTIVITIENADDALADMFAERVRTDAQLNELGAKINVTENEEPERPKTEPALDPEQPAAKRKKK